MTDLGQMWPKYLSLAAFAYNTFNTPNLGNHSPYEPIFGRKPRSLLHLESTPNIKVSSSFKEYYELLNKRLKYLHNLLLNFKSKRLAMINKDRAFFSIQQQGFKLYNFTANKSAMHCFKKGHNKICRSSCYL